MKDFLKNISDKMFVNNNGMNFLTPTGSIPFHQEKMS